MTTKPKIVRVISPATLQEGATFQAVVDEIEFYARVPKGGVQKGEAFETMYPTTIRVISPAALKAGERFKAEYDGTKFLAIVPVGGVQKGDLFETLHPSVAPPKTAGKNTKKKKSLVKSVCCGLPAQCCLEICCHLLGG